MPIIYLKNHPKPVEANILLHRQTFLKYLGLQAHLQREWPETLTAIAKTAYALLCENRNGASVTAFHHDERGDLEAPITIDLHKIFAPPQTDDPPYGNLFVRIDPPMMRTWESISEALQVSFEEGVERAINGVHVFACYFKGGYVVAIPSTHGARYLTDILT